MLFENDHNEMARSGPRQSLNPDKLRNIKLNPNNGKPREKAHNKGYNMFSRRMDEVKRIYVQLCKEYHVETTTVRPQSNQKVGDCAGNMQSQRFV